MRSHRHLSQHSIWKEWDEYFRHRNSIKFSKNNIDSKIIKSHQWSLERSHAVSIEFNTELYPRFSSF